MWSPHKYEHISHHYHSLKWMPFESLVQYRSLCVMYKMFKFQYVPLQPSFVLFGCTHSHWNRMTVFFVQPFAANCPLLRNIFEVKHQCGGMFSLKR